MVKPVRRGAVAVATAALVAAWVAGCSKEPPPATPVEEIGDEVPVLRRFPPESSGGITEPLRTVVRDVAALEALWRRAASHRAPLPPPPAVDFTKEMVAFVSLGTKPSGGHGVEIVGARRVDGALVVLVSTYAPREGEMSATVITQPWHMAVLPRTGGEVRWADYVPPDTRLGTNLNR